MKLIYKGRTHGSTLLFEFCPLHFIFKIDIYIDLNVKRTRLQGSGYTAQASC